MYSLSNTSVRARIPLVSYTIFICFCSSGEKKNLNELNKIEMQTRRILQVCTCE